jgi:hypothetical protein
MQPTPVSLLARLRQPEQHADAWGWFVDLYTRTCPGGRAVRGCRSLRRVCPSTVLAGACSPSGGKGGIMTEAEWLACLQPGQMLAFVRKRSGRRESVSAIWPLQPARRFFRLFACACCREEWCELADRRAKRAVEVAERFADGTAKPEELDIARAEVREGLGDRGSLDARPGLWLAGTAAAGQATIHDGAAGAARMLIDRRARQWLGLPREGEPYHDDGGRDAWKASRHKVGCLPCALVRDIFGNPFRSTVLRPDCRTPVSLSLAQTAYDERILPSGHLDLVRLAILSDALEEVGCDDTSILDHLRGPGPHVRGCWAVDLVSSKE